MHATAARCISPADRRATRWLAKPESKTVHFIRHGEGVHQRRAAAEAERGNICVCDELEARGETPHACPYWDPALIDAPLTEEGLFQIEAAAMDCGAEVVFAAASTRGLQTATVAFASRIARSSGASANSPPRVIALEELRARTSGHMHTRRSPRSVLRESFPQVDLSRVEAEEDRLWRPETESRRSLDTRATSFLRTLFARKERSIAVITHTTMFLTLFQPAAEGWVIGKDPLRDDSDPAIFDCTPSDDAERLRRLPAIGQVHSLIVVPKRPQA